jgi:hypothetical protein
MVLQSDYISRCLCSYSIVSASLALIPRLGLCLGLSTAFRDSQPYDVSRLRRKVTLGQVTPGAQPCISTLLTQSRESFDVLRKVYPDNYLLRCVSIREIIQF